MKKALVIAATGLLAWLSLAWLLVLPPFEPSPSFWKSAEDGTWAACNSALSGRRQLPLGFSQDGKIATIRVDRQEIMLSYSGSGTLGIDDTYRNGPWTLTLDPEINLTGPRRIHYRPC